jgi:hypothetical protein
MNLEGGIISKILASGQCHKMRRELALIKRDFLGLGI